MLFTNIIAGSLVHPGQTVFLEFPSSPYLLEEVSRIVGLRPNGELTGKYKLCIRYRWIH